MRRFRLPFLFLAFALFAATLHASSTLTMDPWNDPPKAEPDLVIFRSGPGVPVELPVLANDTDPDNDWLTLLIPSPANGTVYSAGDRLVYTPNRSFFYEERFIYGVRDRSGNSSSAEVVVRNPFHLMRGTYETPTLFEGEEQPDVLRVSVTAEGQVTGTLKVGKKLRRFQGSLDLDGTLTTELPGWDGDTITLQFTSTAIEGPSARWRTVLTGTARVYGSNRTLKPTEALGLPAFTSAQRVTMLLEDVNDPTIDHPGAKGFAVGTLSASGKLRLVGRMPGNQPFATGAAMKRDGTFTIDVTPKGWEVPLKGEFTLTDCSEGILHWEASLRQRFLVGNPEPPTPENPDWTYFIEVYRTIKADMGTYDPAKVRFVLNLPEWTSVLEVESFAGLHSSGAGVIGTDFRCIFEEGNTPMRLHIDRATGLTRGAYLETYEGQRWRNLSGVVFLPFGSAEGLIKEYTDCAFRFYPAFSITYEGN